MEDLSKYHSDLTKYAQTLENCEHSTKDLVQETYLRAYKADNFENRADIKTWLINIMRNIWKNNMKKKRPYTFDLNDESNQRLVSDCRLPMKSNRKPALSEIE